MSDYTFNSIAIVKINPHRVRNILIIIFTVIFTVVFFSSLSGQKGLRVIHDPGSPEVYPFGRNTLASFSSVSFFSSDRKVLLKGWFFRAENSRKALIFLHDHTRNRLIFGDETDVVINKCIDAGYNVLLFDQRNSGNVDVSKATLGLNEAYDVEGAVLYATALDMKEIYIVAFGSGANAFMNAVKHESIKAAVLDSPYYKLSSALKFVYGENDIGTVFFTKSFTRLFLRRFDSARTYRYDKDYFIGTPPTLITRSGFSYMSTGEERRMYEVMDAYSEYPVILAAIDSHTDAPGYIDMVFSFFDEYAKKQEVPE